eukprot:scaffold17687_cov126-Isochrysis_galbana.AAC.1
MRAFPSPFRLHIPVGCSQIDFDAQLERVARERDAAGSVKLSHKQAAYRAFASCEAEASSEGDGSSEAKSGTLAESVLVRLALWLRAMHAPEHARGGEAGRGRGTRPVAAPGLPADGDGGMVRLCQGGGSERAQDPGAGDGAPSGDAGAAGEVAEPGARAGR